MIEDPKDPNTVQEEPPTQYRSKFNTGGLKVVLWGALGLAAILMVIALAYVLFIRDGFRFRGESSVLIEIVAPEELPSGSQLAYEITLKNESRSRLNGVVLEMYYPRGFSFISASPSPTDHNRRFEVGELGAGQQIDIIILGTLTGSISEIKTVRAKALYMPDDFRSLFDVEESARTLITAPGLTFELVAPSHLISGQTIEYKVYVTNRTDRAFNNVEAVVNYPEKFEFSTASPQESSIDEGGRIVVWHFDAMSPDERKEIILKGKLPAAPHSESLVSGELFLSSGGEREAIGKSFAFTQIRPSPLLITHRAKLPQSANIDMALPGQVLQYEISYENISNVGLNNVRIAVYFESAEIFDIGKASAQTGELIGNRIEWVPARNSNLSIVRAGQSGTFSFSIPIRADVASRLQKNLVARTSIDYFSEELPERISGNVYELPLQSRIGLDATARVVDIGQNLYEVTLRLSNTLNDVDEAMVEMRIPGAATEVQLDSIEPSSERNRVHVNTLAGTMSWRVGDIFAFTGAFHEHRTLRFYTTSPSQPLLENIVFTGKDKFTGNTLQSNTINRLEGR